MKIVGTIETENGLVRVSQVDQNNGKDVYAITQGPNCISLDSYDARDLVRMLEKYEAMGAK